MKKLLLLLISCQTFLCMSTVGTIFNHHTHQRSREYTLRIGASLRSTLLKPNYSLSVENNGDAKHENKFYAAHTKSFEHDPETGLLTQKGLKNYQKLLNALSSGKQQDYNSIELYEGATKLVNPQASTLAGFAGIPSNLLQVPLFPELSSKKAAAQIIELYLCALCRRVRFDDYGMGDFTDRDAVNGGSITANAAAILTALGENYQGPKNNEGIVTPHQLFRLDAHNALIGPYISQFLYKSIPHIMGLHRPIFPHYPIVHTSEFGVSWNDFIALQNGIVPKEQSNEDFIGQPAYITLGRDLGMLVHVDDPGEIFFDTLKILSHNKFPCADSLPYTDHKMPNETGFVSMGIADISMVLFNVSAAALKHAWAHKWRAQRVLRPEAFAGLIHHARESGEDTYNLDDSIFETYQTKRGQINLLTWVRSYNALQESGYVNNPLNPPLAQTYVLSQLYPEGAPASPSYPSGHAAVAGACCTILKAFFKDDALIIDHFIPRKPSPTFADVLVDLTPGEAQELTVGGELNKLASNIAMGRCFAGVNYRADALEGILLGEQVALHYLQDHAHLYSEQGFKGFELTLFQGQRVRVTTHGIENIS